MMRPFRPHPPQSPLTHLCLHMWLARKIFPHREVEWEWESLSYCACTVHMPSTRHIIYEQVTHPKNERNIPSSRPKLAFEPTFIGMSGLRSSSLKLAFEPTLLVLTEVGYTHNTMFEETIFIIIYHFPRWKIFSLAWRRRNNTRSAVFLILMAWT